jgi:hypothetical protein
MTTFTGKSSKPVSLDLRDEGTPGRRAPRAAKQPSEPPSTDLTRHRGFRGGGRGIASREATEAWLGAAAERLAPSALQALACSPAPAPSCAVSSLRT